MHIQRVVLRNSYPQSLVKMSQSPCFFAIDCGDYMAEAMNPLAYCEDPLITPLVRLVLNEVKVNYKTTGCGSI